MANRSSKNAKNLKSRPKLRREYRCDSCYTLATFEGRYDVLKQGVFLLQRGTLIVQIEAWGRPASVVEKLMDKGKNFSPEEEKLLKLFARLIEDFESVTIIPGKQSRCRCFTSNGSARREAN